MIALFLLVLFVTSLVFVDFIESQKVVNELKRLRKEKGEPKS